MKSIVMLLLIGCLFTSCKSYQNVVNESKEILLKDRDTVRIANDAIEYEIIIIEPGFNYWLKSTARPEGYYTQSYLESRNKLYVSAWNQRVLNPISYGNEHYLMRIDYDYGIDYGYEVNYILYNYFIYFQLTYKQRLTGFIPRI
ncbi:hypothetical protein A9Q87_12100 [Flavobacteriales bacterium 34_180_T64]|nr:hypothetical protein A9Q87_12100 [Flavobacteriales bacterium 34_180_T64]